MTEYDENECITFYRIAIKRLQQGYSEDAVFEGKPRGFTEWLKHHHEVTGGIRLPKIRDMPKTTCWNCNKEYVGNKCPQCGAFKPKR